MPAETSVVAELAVRYATALFDLAKEDRVLDAIADDLGRLKALHGESAELRRLIRSPVISREEQAAAMTAILDRAGASALTVKFVAVLARNRRLFALAAIIERFFVLLAEHRGEVAAEVTSARPLDESELAAVREALARVVGRDVNLSADVDAGLIGGLVVRVGSRMVDSSIRTKLQRLRFAMKGVG